MSDNQKYYYLMLKDGFFDREEIKIIKGMPDGDTYVCIMLELYLRSLKRGGKLMMNDRIPYSLDTLSSVLSRPVAFIKAAIEIFTEFELLDVCGNGEMWMSDIQNFIGKSSTEGDRKRLYRNKIKSSQKQIGTNGGQSSTINKDRTINKTRIKDITTTTTIERITDEKAVVVVDYWCKKWKVSKIEIDDSLERVIKNSIKSFGLQGTKKAIANYFKYYNDSTCWVNVKLNMFDFINHGTFFAKMFHANDETYLNTVKKDNDSSHNMSDDGGF